MVWGRSKEACDGLEEITYRSYTSNWWNEGAGGLLIKSRSETDLTSSAASLALPAPLPQSTPLHKCLRVLAGSWKNLFQLGGMSRGGKVTQAKKVAPPSVPEKAGFRNSGSSFGSAGYASAGEDPVFTDTKDGFDTGDGIYSVGGKSPGAYSYTAFTFPGPGPQPYTQITGKSSVYYQHQSLQEDQGIDMTQSPGRDSPGSSGSGSRHSTVSLDSGRASCHMSNHHRPSLSSSSVGSGDSSIPHKVDRLIIQGVPDQEILQSWLLDLHFEEYFPLFVNAGYDMHTISRMTPEDLTAIGIKKPHHRKKLKAEIAQLNISDGLPDYIPGSLSEWLRLLRLEEYSSLLKTQGYTTVDDTTKIQVEDLEDIGIIKLGHQKRFLLAIKRLHDLKAGKTFPPTPFTPTTQVDEMNRTVSECTVSACPCPRVHQTIKQFHQPWEIESSLYYTDIVPIQIRGVRGKSLESLEGDMSACCLDTTGGMSSFTSGWQRTSRGYYEDGDITPETVQPVIPYPQGGGTLPRQRPPLMKPRPPTSNHRISSHITDMNMSCNMGTMKRPVPPVPVRISSDCSSVTVVADLHVHKPPQQYNNNSTQQLDSQSSFKSSSSTESDILPFANENAGTIKQRAVRNQLDYIPPIRVQSPPSDSSSSTVTSRKTSKDSEDVLNDIGNMLANLTDELDAMLEEEKRQGLVDDTDNIDY